MPIENISDTARWVAIYRAMETERPDAIFRDPFARKLAGDRGEDIVNTMKQGRSMAWAMIVRTAVMDELLVETIKGQNVDLVVNLAAGLDARPWRLDLPSTLQWVDVDLPEISQYKRDVIGSAPPKFHYESIDADLTDDRVRQAILTTLGARGKRVFVITEGLLIYLEREQVESLARALHAQASFKWWMIDLAHPELLKMMSRTWGKQVAAGNAPFKFAPPEGTAFFPPLGWKEKSFRSSMEEARRLKREMGAAPFFRVMSLFMSKKRKEVFRKFSGIVLLERA